MLYLVCFDISDDKIRNRVGNYLEAFGNRVQKSVFEVELDDRKALAYLQVKLGSWLEDGDDMRFYPLCQSCCQGAVAASNQRIAKLPSLVVI
jgi:CRISPR-associated protein Cas2